MFTNENIADSPKEYHAKEIISEEAFLRLVHNATVDVLRISQCLAGEQVDPKLLTKRLFYVISVTARELEDFLDDHGAKNNRDWYFFRELVATARTFGFVAFLVEHIETRYLSFQDKKSYKSYFERTKSIRQYYNQLLIQIFTLIQNEAQRLNISFPPQGLSEHYYYDIPSNKILPPNLNEEEDKNEKESIIKICSQFINITQEFDDLECDRRYPPQQLSKMIPAKVNEEKIRRFELFMHNLESVYDTYVKDTSLEAQDPGFNKLRTQISIILHLLEIARALAHFYERHEKINTLLEQAVPGNSVPNCVVNWALYHTDRMMRSSKLLAEELLRHYAAMDSIQLPVPKNLGFHLRPSTLVAKVVNHYGSDAYLIVGNDKFDAKSVLSITWAGGKIAREKIDEVTFVGEKRVLDDLETLASVNYGEDHMGKNRPLPKKLSYLR
ncbi:MAG: HPr family phosphocarrier protein [Deltaproteobacteria bacterium]|nr:HPr family phosphocarrier protein [Deltaproteobacteria bacterium]